MPDSQELASVVAEFGKSYARWLRDQLEHTGTTPARARLMMVLKCGGAQKMSRIGEQLSVTPRSVTKLVDGLEREGLVAREPSPHDRRATLVHLTESGERVCKESMLANHAAAAELYDELSERERRDFARVIRKLQQSLTQRGY
ncbi:putative HTH-type transcriptional regulator YusO [Planctomycetes bacterium Pan216]|uniref:Putative HTH-type transcriptional regulator YusO n=1 Tax=Kolteria novifilia TaxID=2527975 RepID=A0A518B0L3_9BACT|nr:putative HTH-type transcriptional regulator YusO [Planctomycetes bacterium Pan216]